MIQKTYYKTKPYAKVNFSIELPEAETVAVLGLNNNWKKGLPLTKKKNGVFAADINLDKETQHEFKYLINKKEWVNDPTADTEVQNVYGGTNSLVII